jgi:hypothetical protein
VKRVRVRKKGNSSIKTRLIFLSLVRCGAGEIVPYIHTYIKMKRITLVGEEKVETDAEDTNFVRIAEMQAHNYSCQRCNEQSTCLWPFVPTLSPRFVRPPYEFHLRCTYRDGKIAKEEEIQWFTFCQPCMELFRDSIFKWET